MSPGGRIVIGLVEALGSVIVSAIAAPVIWFMIRLAGLVPLMITLFGRPDRLMYLGGAFFGALVGMATIAAITAALDEIDRVGMALGALGGATGGLAGSVMFFPIVVFL